jgi:hypothetical protein
VRPEKSIGNLHEALLKFNSKKFAATASLANTNALSSATNQPAPSAN